MGTLIDHMNEWKGLKEQLVVHGDFVLGDPLITDEIIKETEEIVRKNAFEMRDFSSEQIEKLFYRKVDERIIYEEPAFEEELCEEDFIDESEDAIIREVIAKMITDIKMRRGYEY